jgi:hypothetical protein
MVSKKFGFLGAHCLPPNANLLTARRDLAIIGNSRNFCGAHENNNKAGHETKQDETWKIDAVNRNRSHCSEELASPIIRASRDKILAA